MNGLINNKAMKKHLMIMIVAGSVLSSCDDFLSETPDNRAKLDSKEKIAELLVTAYPEGNYIPFCEAMSDNVEDNFGGGQDVTNADPYFWRDGAATWQDSPENYWNNCYTAIASANHALRAIEESENPDELAAQKGEALVAESLCTFYAGESFLEIVQRRNCSVRHGDTLCDRTGNGFVEEV